MIILGRVLLSLLQYHDMGQHHPNLHCITQVDSFWKIDVLIVFDRSTLIQVDRLSN